MVSRFVNVKMQMAFSLNKPFGSYAFTKTVPSLFLLPPTLHVLFQSFFTKTIPERLGLESWFKGGIEEWPVRAREDKKVEEESNGREEDVSWNRLVKSYCLHWYSFDAY